MKALDLAYNLTRSVVTSHVTLNT